MPEVEIKPDVDINTSVEKDREFDDEFKDKFGRSIKVIERDSDFNKKVVDIATKLTEQAADFDADITHEIQARRHIDRADASLLSSTNKVEFNNESDPRGAQLRESARQFIDEVREQPTGVRARARANAMLEVFPDRSGGRTQILDAQAELYALGSPMRLVDAFSMYFTPGGRANLSPEVAAVIEKVVTDFRNLPEGQVWKQFQDYCDTVWPSWQEQVLCLDSIMLACAPPESSWTWRGDSYSKHADTLISEHRKAFAEVGKSSGAVIYAEISSMSYDGNSANEAVSLPTDVAADLAATSVGYIAFSEALKDDKL